MNARRRVLASAAGTLLAGFAAWIGFASTADAANPDYNRVARRATPAVDGKLDDPAWKAADWQELDVYAGGARPNGFAAKSAVLWDDKYFYTAIEVKDAVHAVPKAVVPDAVNLWQGDSPQHRVDLEYDGIAAAGEDIEWGYADQDGKLLMNAWASPNNIEFTTIKVVRDNANKMTFYETALILKLHKPNITLSAAVKETPKMKIGYSDMVNANDGAGRLGWLEWSSGIGASKNAALFGTLTFDSTPLAVSPSGKLAAAWAEVKSAR